MLQVSRLEGYGSYAPRQSLRKNSEYPAQQSPRDTPRSGDLSIEGPGLARSGPRSGHLMRLNWGNHDVCSCRVTGWPLRGPERANLSLLSIGHRYAVYAIQWLTRGKCITRYSSVAGDNITDPLLTKWVCRTRW